MSQRAIREYDAKTLWSAYSGVPYQWVLVSSQDELDSLSSRLAETGIEHFVVKPDQLFGKRGKHGLVWVKLDVAGVVEWISSKWQQTMDIDGTEWVLDTFLVEQFVPHDDEWYIAIKTDRDHDIIYFSPQWWVEVEENRDSVSEIKVPVGSSLDIESVTQLGITNTAVQDFVMRFYSFFVDQWFAYLEVNPFVIPSPPTPLPQGTSSDSVIHLVPNASLGEGSNVVCLDMVARVDTCEEWKQKSWEHVSWVKAFGAETHPLEAEIESMDAETGASLKFSTLNPRGRIGLLLGGGWASVLAMDKLSDMWLMDEVINYGELSGNPNYRHNKAYIQWLIDLMIDNQDATWKKRLCVIWGISNFTKIDVFCRAFVDAVSEKVDEVKKAEINVFVRRGWVNDTKWLWIIQTFCDTYQIPCSTSDGDVYVTDAMETLVAGD